MKFISFLILITLNVVLVFAQSRSSSSFTMQNNIGKNSPYWFHTNQNGIVDDSGLGAYLVLKTKFSSELNKDLNLFYEIKPVLRISSNSNIIFPIINAGISFKKLNFIIGRFNYEELHPLEDLRTGSFVQSRNATPIPKIELKTDFIYVPFTKQFAKVKGTFTHGWFEENRTVKNPFLHQKTFYLFVGKEDSFNIYGGLVHSVIWGGFSRIESIGNIPESYNDFIRSVFLGRGSDDAPLNDQNYYQGNQLGIYDLGISFKKKGWDVEVYKQFLFEDYDGVVLRNFQDGIVGIALEKKESNDFLRFIQAINYEFIYTKYQTGSTHPEDPNRTKPGSGRDDYYSHVIYRNGWTSYGRIIGNPLITLRSNRNFDQYLVENNRVVAHHIALKGAFLEELNYLFKLTYSNNHGRYLEEQAADDNSYEYKFEPALNQVSIFLKLITPSKKWEKLQFHFGVAGDIGELYENGFAIQFGIKKSI